MYNTLYMCGSKYFCYIFCKVLHFCDLKILFWHAVKTLSTLLFHSLHTHLLQFIYSFVSWSRATQLQNESKSWNILSSSNVRKSWHRERLRWRLNFANDRSSWPWPLSLQIALTRTNVTRVRWTEAVIFWQKLDVVLKLLTEIIWLKEISIFLCENTWDYSNLYF